MYVLLRSLLKFPKIVFIIKVIALSHPILKEDWSAIFNQSLYWLKSHLFPNKSNQTFVSIVSLFMFFIVIHIFDIHLSLWHKLYASDCSILDILSILRALKIDYRQRHFVKPIFFLISNWFCYLKLPQFFGLCLLLRLCATNWSSPRQR